MQNITLHITGMACGGCAATIEKALRALDGVLKATVSHPDATAEVGYDPAKIQPEQIQECIVGTGYGVQ